MSSARFGRLSSVLKRPPSMASLLSSFSICLKSMLIHASSTLVLRSSALTSRTELVRLSSVLIRTQSALEHLSRVLVGLSSVLIRPSSTVCGLLLPMSFLAKNNLVDLQGDHTTHNALSLTQTTSCQAFTYMLHTGEICTDRQELGWGKCNRP